MAQKGLLIVISGPSGAGKGTICKELLKKEDLWVSVSATTRSPRKGEENGVHYFFLSEDEFNERIKKDDFLEYAKVHQNLYGTPKSSVLEKINNGNNVILEIDIQGGFKSKRNLSRRNIYIYIASFYGRIKK